MPAAVVATGAGFLEIFPEGTMDWICTWDVRGGVYMNCNWVTWLLFTGGCQTGHWPAPQGKSDVLRLTCKRHVLQQSVFISRSHGQHMQLSCYATSSKFLAISISNFYYNSSKEVSPARQTGKSLSHGWWKPFWQSKLLTPHVSSHQMNQMDLLQHYSLTKTIPVGGRYTFVAVKLHDFGVPE